MKQAQSVIPHIIDQHAEEAAFLWLLRHNAVYAPHYNLKDLTKLDGRVEAHIDGLRIAGDYGWEACRHNLEFKERGEVFTAAILALEGNHIDRINKVYQVAEEAPEALDGLISAFGWVEPHFLQGKVNGLLVSKNPLWRQVGIAACAIHRVDPGKFLDQAIQDDDNQLRARALRAAGELGRVDLKPVLLEQINNQNPVAGFWAAWSVVLLGGRGKALFSLQTKIIEGSDFSLKAMQPVLRVLNLQEVKELLKVLAQNGDRTREAVIGAGISGDPGYMPWLIKQMEVPELAKIAGESFSFISGVDIAYDDLEGELPESFVTGPTENPEDDEVAMDADEDLPCPDPLLIDRWWKQHQESFKPGVRYLLGKPVNELQCQHILKTGKQRQRQAAALELSLMRPATPLFETRAMGKRQQKLLL
ncbi:MAG: TIGR02270 family protein [Methylococcales bacterium]|nr:TIGR02270 family protein [Methylococcales bacterium]MDD5631441.1 TIGR02270 family protein [Methylococcales bacterium]